MEKRILEAVNEMENQNFKSFDEILDIYTFKEIISYFLTYEGYSYGCQSEIKDIYELFYIMIPKHI